MIRGLDTLRLDTFALMDALQVKEKIELLEVEKMQCDLLLISFVLLFGTGKSSIKR